MSSHLTVRMQKKVGVLLLALELCILPFFIFLSLIANAYGWTTVLVAGYIGEIYTVYRRIYGKKKEKLQIESQIPAGRYYYDRWYYPADSTRMSFLADKARELKSKLRRK